MGPIIRVDLCHDGFETVFYRVFRDVHLFRNQLYPGLTPSVMMCVDVTRIIFERLRLHGKLHLRTSIYYMAVLKSFKISVTSGYDEQLYSLCRLFLAQATNSLTVLAPTAASI